MALRGTREPVESEPSRSSAARIRRTTALAPDDRPTRLGRSSGTMPFVEEVDGGDWAKINDSLARSSKTLSDMSYGNAGRLAQIEAVGERIDREIAENRAVVSALINAFHGC